MFRFINSLAPVVFSCISCIRLVSNRSDTVRKIIFRLLPREQLNMFVGINFFCFAILTQNPKLVLAQFSMDGDMEWSANQNGHDPYHQQREGENSKCLQF